MVTEKDYLRMDLVGRAARHESTAKEVAQALGLSIRQVRRLIKVFRVKGAKGLIHGNRGRQTRSRVTNEVREKILALMRGEYQDYNTSQIRYELSKEYGITLSYSTVYRLRREAGLSTPYGHRVRQHRLRRERAEREGLLLQADGSTHQWLEERGPHLTLIAYIDDATGKIAGATFRDQEDAVGYLQVLGDICQQYGTPQALYTDQHTILRSPKQATIEQKLRGEAPLSAVGQVLKQLGIRHIVAQSPQAKGRVERLFGTLQDRLVKHLRSRLASTREQANLALQDYICEHNRLFAKPASSPSPAYRPWTQGLVADEVFAFKCERVVSNDNTIAYGGVHLPIPPGPYRKSYAKARVSVSLHLDGRLVIYYRNELIASFAHDPNVPVRVDHFVPAAPILLPTTSITPNEPVSSVSKPRQPKRPALDHPWRRAPLNISKG